MNTKSAQILLFWLGCLGSPSLLFGQVGQPDCVDYVSLKSGSFFEGKIIRYQPGDTLTMITRTGLTLSFADAQVKKIVQKCPGQKKMRAPQVYSFREKGWYNATRVGVLAGDAYWGQAVSGFFLQHTTGLMLSRKFGYGLGFGVENFTPGEDDATTYPVFAEARSYLLPARISPYFALGAGYAFAGRVRETQNFGNFRTEDWHGGWMAQGIVGYRIGNHFTVDFGLRLQRKTRVWSRAGAASETGEDKILHKRLVVGLGILF